LIVAFAIGNVMFLKSSRDVAAEYVDAARGVALDGVAVHARRAVVVGGVRGDRWLYGYRERVTGKDRLIDLVAVLRAVRPPVTSLDYYEYAFSLETTPESYRADVGEFDRLLGTVAFSKPER
jgi:hypothetical protein